MNVLRSQGDANRADESYYPWFDWLRGALALVVMLQHDKLIGWPKAGIFAVDVFFALSGWLIGRMLIHTPRTQLPRFYFNRAVRIWTPYYIALALLVAASLFRDHAGRKWCEFVFYKATFVYNLFGTTQVATHAAEMPLAGTGNHFWSVNTEEQFYLVAPLLLVLAVPAFGRSRITWLLLALLAWALDSWSSIVFGVCAAVFAAHEATVFQRPLARAALVLVGVASAVGMAAGLPFERLAPLTSICIVLSLAVPGPRQRLGAVVGGMSYPLYLNHWIGTFLANALTKPFGLRGTVLSHTLSALIAIGLAVTLYLKIERPLLARRSAWFTPALGRRAALTAYAMVGVGVALGLVLHALQP